MTPIKKVTSSVDKRFNQNRKSGAAKRERKKNKKETHIKKVQIKKEKIYGKATDTKSK